jgi:hypothetical protein
MATDKKISQLSSGAPAQGTDETVIARSGSNFKLTVAQVVGFLGTPITVANGGTGASTLTGYVKGSGTSAFTASASIPGSDVSGNISGNAANVTGTVAVGNGGTGATTLTGYVKGSGTSAFTASASIPGSDISGNISGNAANVTGVVAVANGGTGLSSTPSNGQINIGNGTGFTQATITAGSGISITNGAGSISIAATGTSPIPSGSAMLFVQTAAPTGWTKSTTHDNKALRVVSGSASSGGSVTFTTAFASQGVAGTIGNTTATNQATTATNTATTATNQNTTAGGSVSTSVSGSVSGTTLSTGEMPSHAHSISNMSTAGVPNGAFNTAWVAAGTYGTNAEGGSGSHSHGWSGSGSSSFSGTAHSHTQDAHNHTQSSHNHTQDAHNHSFTGTAINLAVQYVDVIVATKD